MSKHRYFAHNGLAGCVLQRRVRSTGGVVSVYIAEQAGLDMDGGDWVTMCERHGTVANWPTLRLALWHLPAVDWCEDCEEARRPQEKGA